MNINWKERIFTNWTVVRAFYLILGIAIIFQSVTSQQWFGVAMGAYVFSMGLLAFGCAAGTCLGTGHNTEQKKVSPEPIREIPFEEVKTK